VKYIEKLVDYSKEVFVNNLLKVEWYKSYSMEVNNKLEFLSDHLKKCVNEFVKTIRVSNSNTKVWYNKELFDQRKLRDNLYKVAYITGDRNDWLIYVDVSKDYAWNVKVTKNNYYYNKLLSMKDNQKKTWKMLKNIVNGVPEETSEYIEFDGVKVHNESDIAEKFNKYFIESIDDINSSIPESICDQRVNDINEIEVLNEFKFCPADMSDLESIVQNIRSKVDSEHLNKTVMKDVLSVIGMPMLDAINSSLEFGVVAKSWKNSVLIPTPKVNGTMKCEEFRPVNMLPNYEKILEGVVKQQINSHMDSNKIIINEQFGFRKNHSCETALNMIQMDWKNDIDNGNVVIAVFLDLKRAFETVDRKRLLRKLRKYGINGVELKWFESYLSERTQCTKFGGVTSAKIPTRLGVPQGSKLASELFLLYVNDIIKSVVHSKLALFADDTLVYISGKNVQEVVDKLNEDLSRVNSWLNVNKLKLNVHKTKYMILNNGKNSDLDNVCVTIDGSEIERVNEFKYLVWVMA